MTTTENEGARPSLSNLSKALSSGSSKDDLLDPYSAGVLGVQSAADEIAGEWRKTIEGILGAGQALARWKLKLPHGEFGRMFVDSNDPIERPLPFSSSTARYLMKIVSHPALRNRDYSHDLPPAWRTLSHLAKLPGDVIEAYIDDRVITPELDQNRAYRLVREWKESTHNADGVAKSGRAAGRRRRSEGVTAHRVEVVEDISVDAKLVREDRRRREPVAGYRAGQLQGHRGTGVSLPKSG